MTSIGQNERSTNKRPKQVEIQTESVESKNRVWGRFLSAKDEIRELYAYVNPRQRLELRATDVATRPPFGRILTYATGRAGNPKGAGKP